MSGEADPRLTSVGRLQAKRLGRWLAGEQVDAVVTSPMARARETAEVAVKEMQRRVTAVVDDLREWEQDHDAHGRYVALEELGAGNTRYEALKTGRYEDFVPAIDRVEFLSRARAVMQELIRRWPNQRVAAFSHGGLINAALSSVLGLEDQLFFFLPDYTSISTVRVMPGGRLVVRALNCTGHMVGQRDSDLTGAHDAVSPDLKAVRQRR
jgi:2,3-bisphosphoglycerate-dependent phosphoglycerate mutase